MLLQDWEEWSCGEDTELGDRVTMNSSFCCQHDFQACYVTTLSALVHLLNKDDRCWPGKKEKWAHFGIWETAGSEA